MTMRNVVLGLLLTACGVGSCFGADGAVRYRQLSEAEYEDKVAGGWIGQAVGVLWGQWTEGKWQGQMVPFDLKDWYRIKPAVQAKMQNIKNPKERAEFRDRVKNDPDNWEIWQPDKMSDQDDLYIEFMFLHSIEKYGLDVTGTEIARDWVKYLDKSRVW
ncbi:MAG TPA: hypothetical protein ENI81_11475, partial [Phycisphaerales bacterium]|nr:hypothetical protein [Phycisphaerales bacterium]